MRIQTYLEANDVELRDLTTRIAKGDEEAQRLAQTLSYKLGVRHGLNIALSMEYYDDK